MRCKSTPVTAALLIVLAVGCRPQTTVVAPPAAAPRRRIAAPPPGNNWALSPEKADRLFAHGPIELVSMKATPQGVAGAFKAVAKFPTAPWSGDVKWKAVPPAHVDGWNNNPRKELAAYEIQRWFLSPQDYVVPTIAVRCIPLTAYRRVDPDATATIPDTSCVLGTFSLWMQHVTVPDDIYDATRFAKDDAYAYHLANFNVLTYLIAHRDGRPGNILVADTDTNRRVFAVDNGISFDGLIYNFLVPNWDIIRVPAIRRDVVERLRTIDHRQLEKLATMVELRADKKGVLNPIAVRPPLDPTTGVRVEGRRVQLGLTADEIDALGKRIAALLAQVDAGTLAVF